MLILLVEFLDNTLIEIYGAFWGLDITNAWVFECSCLWFLVELFGVSKILDCR